MALLVGIGLHSDLYVADDRSNPLYVARIRLRALLRKLQDPNEDDRVFDSGENERNGACVFGPTKYGAAARQ